MRRSALARALIAILLTPLAVACTSGPPAATEAPNAVDQVELKAPVTLSLWHTQTGSNATALQAMIDDFNRTNDKQITVKLEYQGAYPQLYQKTVAAINANALPDLAVAYESFVADYMKATPSPVVELDPYVNSKKYGLTKESLDDIFKAYIDTNRFAQFGDKLLSFPFTKSLLIMYQNDDILKELGMSTPKTWDDFERVAAAAKKMSADGKTVARYGWAVISSASTYNGWVLSRGGRLMSEDNKTAKWDGAEGLASLQLLDKCIKAQWCYVPKGFDYQNDFGAGKAAFVMESSTGRPFFKASMKDPKPNWSIVSIPQKDPANARTVMYGANIAAFKSTPEKQLASWLFMKWFAEPPQTAKWSITSSYMPVRKSAANDAALKDSWSKADPQGKQAFDLNGTSVPEPNVRGQQDVRTVIEDAMTAVLTQKSGPDAALQTASTKANQILKDNQ
jgi:ABC-type glycerol-3-phosphate transport system substrate-binding protein